MKKGKGKLAVFAAASVLWIPAYAADTGGYILGSFGATKFHSIDTSGINVASKDDTGTGFKLGGGYMINKNFGVEGAYVHLGQATVTGTPSFAFSGTVKAHGLVVAALGVWPISEQFSLLGRLGFINAAVEVSAQGQSESSTDLKLTFGAGAAYAITKALSVRLDYDYYDSLGNSSTFGESSIEMISLGVVYKFQ